MKQRMKNKESSSARDLFNLLHKTMGEDVTRALLLDICAPDERGDKEIAIIRNVMLERVFRELIMDKATLLLVLAALEGKTPAPLAKWAVSYVTRTGKVES